MKKRQRMIKHILAVVLILCMLPFSAYTEAIPYVKAEKAEAAAAKPLSVSEDMEVTTDVTLTEDMEVRNLDITGYGNLYLNGYRLIVREDVTLNGGRLYLDKGSMECMGNITLEDQSQIFMENKNDYLLIHENLYLNADASDLDMGTLEIKGDILGEYKFHIADSERVKTVLSGDRLQTIDVEEHSAFDVIELKNRSEEGVVFTKNYRWQKLIRNDNKYVVSNVKGIFGWILQEDTIIEEDFYLLGDVLDLNGYELTVRGNLYQAGGELYINGGKLTIEQDYRLQAVTLAEEESNGYLRMDRPEDSVVIKGNYINWSYHHGFNELTDGIMEVKGNFELSRYRYNFIAENHHKVILSGTSRQTVTFYESEALAASRFGSLEILNKSKEGIILTIPAPVTGSLNDHRYAIDGTVLAGSGTTIENGWFGGSLIFEESITFVENLEIKGSLELKGESFIENQLIINGDFLANGYKTILKKASIIVKGKKCELSNLEMNNQEDSICVYGDLAFNRGVRMSAGTLEVKGNVMADNIVEGGKLLRVLFSGTKKQTLDLHSSQIFETVEIHNYSSKGIEFIKPITIRNLVQNNCTMTYGGFEGRYGWTLNEDQVIEGDLYLVGGELNLNGHKLTVKGNVTHAAGTIYIDTGILLIEQDYRMAVQYESEEGTKYDESIGILTMVNSSGKIIVRENFICDEAYSGVINLKAGSLEVGGNMSASLGREKFIRRLLLNGTKKQVIDIDGNIYNLIIQNQSENGIVLQDRSSLMVSEYLKAGTSKVEGTIEILRETVLENDYFSGSLEFPWKGSVRDWERDISVGGNLIVRTPVNFKGNVNVSGKLTVYEESSFRNNVMVDGDMEINADVEFTENGANPASKVTIGGDLLIYAPLFLSKRTEVKGRTFGYGSLTIVGYEEGEGFYTGELSGTGKITLMEGRLTVDGSFCQSGSVISDSPFDSIFVKGDYINDSRINRSRFEDGVLEVKGNFEVEGPDFAADGNHRVILSGTKKQVLKLSDEAKFQILELKNESPEGLFSKENIHFEELVENGCRLTIENAKGKYGWKLTGNQVLDGELLLCGGKLDLNGYELKIKGDFIQESGTVIIGEGTLIVEGDYRIQSRFGHESYYGYGTSTGTLSMNAGEGRVFLGGDLIIDSTGKFDLKDGVMEIRGDIYNHKITDAGKGFITLEKHKIIMNGRKAQSINFIKYNYFEALREIANLEIKNENGVDILSPIIIREGLLDPEKQLRGTVYIGNKAVVESCGSDVVFSEEMEITKDLEIGGNLTLEKDAAVKGNLKVGGNLKVEETLTVMGSLKVGGSLVNSGSLCIENSAAVNISKDYEEYKPDFQDAIKMSGKNAYFKVEGNFNKEYGMTDLQEGTLEIKGNMNLNYIHLSTQEGFKLILSGEELQTVTARGSEVSRIQLAEIRNYSPEGIDIRGSIEIVNLVQNGCVVKYGGKSGKMGWTLEADQVITEEVSIIGGVLDLNGHTLLIRGNLLQSGGIVKMNGGSLLVEGDYRIHGGETEEQEYNSAGALVMENSRDYIKVEGDFYTSSMREDSYALTDGTMEIKGNFNRSSSSVFYPEGNHTLIFSGNRQQTVQGLYIVQNIIIRNSSEESIYFESGIHAMGEVSDESGNMADCTLIIEDLNKISGGRWSGSLILDNEHILNKNMEVGGELRMRVGSILDLNHFSVTVGSLSTLSSDVLVNGGTLNCRGDMLLEYYGSITMENEKDYVLVGGDFNSENMDFNLTAGLLEIKKDVNIKGYGDFAPSGQHTTKLSGVNKRNGKPYRQTINLGLYPNAGFHKLILTKPLSGYVFDRDIEKACNELIFDLQDAEAPEKITLVQAKEIGMEGIKLIWEEPADNVESVSYEIYRDGKKIADTRSTVYQDWGLEPDREYRYQIVAMDEVKNKSDGSDPLIVRTLPDTEKPEAPGNLEFSTRTGSSHTISWRKSRDNIKTTEYIIYRNDKRIGAVTGDTTEYKDTMAEQKKKNTYYVRALDAAGNESDPSNSISGFTAMPKITGVDPAQYARIIEKQIPLTVRFENAGNSKGNRVKFEYRSGKEEWRPISSELAEQDSHSGKELTASLLWEVPAQTVSGEYEVRYTLYDADQNETSREVSYIFDFDPPKAPTEVSARSDNGTAMLSWSPSVSAGCNRYSIYRAAKDEGEYVKIAELKERLTHTYTDLEVEPGKIYLYQITARDSFDRESEPALAEAILIDPDYLPPVIMRMTPKSGRIGRETLIRVEAKDNLKVEEISLYYRPEGTGAEEAVVWETRTAVRGMAEFTWESQGMDGSYLFEAEAVDSSGNVISYTQNYEVDTTGMEQIRWKGTKAGASYAQLFWEDVTETDFGYFLVEQKKEDGYAEAGRESSILGITITGLKPETEYTYRVVGYDNLGNRGIESEDITVTTLKDTTPPVIKGIYPKGSSCKGTIPLSMRVSDQEGNSHAVFSYSYNKSEWNKISTVSGSAITAEYSYECPFDTDALPEGEVYVRFEAYDTAGNVNAYQDEPFMVRYRIDRTAPEKAENLKAEGKEGYIGLSWDPGVDPEIAGYRIYRSRDGLVYDTLEELCLTKNYYDQSVKPHTSYYYKIAAVDPAGNVSELSSETIAECFTDSVEPVIRSMTPFTGDLVGEDPKIEVMAGDNAGLSAIRLDYRMAGMEEEYFTALCEDTLTGKYQLYQTRWNTKGLPDGEYEIRVRITDEAGNESKDFFTTCFLDRTAPAAPEAELLQDDWKIVLSWAAISEPDYSHAELYRKSNYEEEYTKLAQTADAFYEDHAVNPEEVYTYKIRVYDKQGNYSESGEVSGYAYSNDSIAPAPKVSGNLLGVAGLELMLDAGASTDNVRITGYTWDMGNGDVITGVQPAYRYEQAGEYEVTLTATDAAGNTAEAFSHVTILDPAVAGTITVTVKNSAGEPIPYAYVYLRTGEEEKICVRANGLGQAVLAANTGEHQIAAFGEGYLPVEKSISVEGLKVNHTELVLESGELVTGNLTVHRMELQEMADAGIDFTNPENYHAYQFTVELTFEQEPIPTYVEYYVIPGKPPVITNTSSENKSCIITGSGDSIYIANLDGGGAGYPSHEAVPVLAYLKVPAQTISWMKDIYGVELGIINHGDPVFSIEGSRAKLLLPEGLSLAATVGEQSLCQSMGTIRGQEKKQAVWYIKGDVLGEYDLEAIFTGTLMPFRAPVKARFQTKESFEVSGGEGLKLYIMPESEAYIGKAYYVQFALANESDREFYNLTTTFGAYQDPGFEQHITVTDQATGHTETYTDEMPAKYQLGVPGESRQVPVLRGGDSLSVGVFASGEVLYGTYSTVFTAEGDPDEVYYRLKESAVKELAGANTGIAVEVKPIPGHILRYNVDIVTIDNSRIWGDPVDAATGGYLDSYGGVSVTGASTLALDLSYHSRLTEQAGEVGKGWSHSYETRLIEENGYLNLYTTPSSHLTFLREEAITRQIDGILVNEQILPDLEQKEGSGQYQCISAGMEDYQMERQEDGNYLLSTPDKGIFTFGSDGDLLRVENQNGIRVGLSREDGVCTITEELSGKQLFLTYDSQGRLVSAADSTGRQTTLAYENGCLTQITNALGETLCYQYDEKGRILSGTWGDGTVFVANSYDEKGRVLTQDDGNPATALTVFSYEDKEFGGSKTKITDRNQNHLEVETGRNGGILKTVDQNGISVSRGYDFRGNLIREQDGGGSVLQYGYDGDGNLTGVKDSMGGATTLGYDGAGNLSSIGGEGAAASYRYDPDGLLVRSVDYGGGVRTYEYNELGQLVREKTVGRGERTFVYEKGQLVESTDYRGGVMRYAYDQWGNLAESTDREGNTTRYTYDALNRLLSVTDACGGTTAYTYDQKGNRISTTDAAGNRTVYAYNNEGLPVKETLADRTEIIYEYDQEGRNTKIREADGRERTFVYDPAGQVVEETMADQSQYRYTWDGAGRLTSETAPDGGETRCSYYPNGKLSRTENPDGSYLQYTYNKRWQKIMESDGEGHTLAYEYDGAGNVTTVRDALGNETRYTYDSFGNCLSRTDAMGGTTVYAYDANGNISEMTDTVGLKSSYTYDGEDRLVKITAHTKEGSKSRSFTYDAVGRLTCTTDEEGWESRTAYDGLGQVTGITDGEGILAARYAYDSRNRLVEVKDSTGRKTGYRYDKAGDLVEKSEHLQDGRVRKTILKYDAMGRPVTVKDALGGTGLQAYDAMGQVSSMAGPGGGVTRYESDRMGRITKEEIEGSKEKTWSYHGSGLLKEAKNGRGQKTAYGYDKAGRLTSLTDALGTVDYTYDNNGNILTVKSAEGTITRSYDSSSRITAYTDYRGRTVTYGYDELGNLLTLTYPGGKIVRYQYYKNGLLKSAKDWNGQTTRYEYDRNGRLTRTLRPDGTTETISYDASGRMSTLKDRKGTKVLRELAYTYDEAGNISQISGTEEGTRGQITAKMKYDANNRLLSYNGKAVRYDEDGNMVYGPLDGSMCELEYDCRNRLVKAGDTVYEYDSEDNRTAQIQKGVRTEYLTDSTAELSRVLLAEESRDGKKGKRKQTLYVYGNGLISEESKERGLLYYHFNHLGSTMALTNQKGQEVRNYQYGPYGEVLAGETEGIRFLFNGQYGVQTDGNGLYFLRARYYNTDSRRFLNRDILTGSIGETQSLNRYAYTQGDPVNHMDPFGLYPGGFGWKAAGHGALDLLGLIPVLGDVLDVVNSVWYFADGDAGQGASSLLSALPALGTAAGPAMKGVLKLSDRSVKGIQGMMKLTGNVSTFGRGAYGGYQNGRQMWEKYAVNREKVGLETITEVGSLALNMLSCLYAGKDVSSTAKELSKLRNRGDGSLRMDLQYFGGSGSKGNGNGDKILGGKFSDVDVSRGADEVGHHVAQNAYNREIGLSRGDGPALLMSKEDHAQTRTFRGRGKKAMVEDKNLSARQRMVLDIIDIRKKFGNKYNEGMLDMIKYAKTLPQYKK